MTDLYLDAAAFEALRSNLRQIRDLLDRPARALAAAAKASGSAWEPQGYLQSARGGYVMGGKSSAGGGDSKVSSEPSAVR